MYGAMRERAPSSTRLAGVITAATMTVAFGYAMAHGMSNYIVKSAPDPIIYVSLPDTPAPETPMPTSDDLNIASDMLELTVPEVLLDTWVAEDTIVGEVIPEPRREIGPAIPTPPQPPAMVRTRASLIPGSKPTYPSAEVRRGSEGLTSLEVCIDTHGRVTAASLASSSGHPGLDDAALKWVRNAKFTPAKLNGEPQSTCGHSVDYQWTLDRR